MRQPDHNLYIYMQSILTYFFFSIFFVTIEGHNPAVTREQFYMISQKRSNEKPPKLPPRDTSLYSHELPTVSV